MKKPTQAKGLSACFSTLTFTFLVVGTGQAINIAPVGTAIIGINDAIDSDEGTPRAQVGVPANINDEDLATKVDNWFGADPTDGGQIYSFVGILWDAPRTDVISSLTLTMATFADGGWFGTSSTSPVAGAPLLDTDPIEPSVQVSSDGGVTWTDVDFTSDYVSSFTGHEIGGGDNPNPTSNSATFTLSSPQTGINGIRLIGENGGAAGADPNGFIGVWELAVDAVPSSEADTDGDGMDDAWETENGLNVGVDDSAEDADSDGLSNFEEFEAGINPQSADTDEDGFSDLDEVTNGTDPTSAASPDLNVALAGTGIFGTNDAIDGDGGTPFEHVGTAANVNDGVYDGASRVDTWSGGADFAYVGVVWDAPWALPIIRLELSLATFFDGGWFGVNGIDPGAGGPLDETYLLEPTVQITTDGTTWTTVDHTSNYLEVFDGHGIGGGTNPNPSTNTALFDFEAPQEGVLGIRIIGSEGGAADNGFLGVFELAIRDERSVGDLDGDGLSDQDETTVYMTDPNVPDTDGDGLSDGQEVLTYQTDPLLVDSDLDGFGDGVEIVQGTDPTDLASHPDNFALAATAISGTNDAIDADAGNSAANAGTTTNINDGDLLTRVDTFSGAAGDSFSFAGLLWENPLERPLDRVEFTLAIFFDGGWFGPVGSGPGSGATLDATYLEEPVVQVTTDGGTTWMDIGFVSDYLEVLDGHPLPDVDFGAPTSVMATFTMQEVVEGVNGVRIIGSEGGTAGAGAGFLGIFELQAFAGANSDPNLLVQRRDVFGELSPGERSVTLNLVNNGETQPLLISSATLTGPDAEFFTLGTVPESVAAGETAGLEITLVPGARTGGFIAFLEIATNDENDPLIEVDLSAIIPNQNGLLARYKLDETEGTQALDGSGRGRHGEYRTSGEANVSLGESPLVGAGTAVRFAPSGGNAGFVEIQDTFPDFVDLSVALWFEMDRADNEQPFALVSKNVPGGEGEPFAVAVTGGTLTVSIGDAGVSTVVATVEGITANETHHLTVIFEQSGETDKVLVYLNGELVAEPTMDGFADSATSPLVIGALSGVFGFEGVIDDVQIYETAITAEDVTYLHANPNMELVGEGSVDPDIDTDGDGLSDEDEAIAGTDPNDPASTFQATETTRTAEGVGLSWSSVAGKSYTVEYSENLAADSWIEVDEVASEGEATTFTDTDATRTANDEGFYRIRVE